MTKHPDGSVTLTAQEFQVCAAFCEMSPGELADLLQAKDGDLTVDDLTRHALQRATLLHFEPEKPDSAN